MNGPGYYREAERLLAGAQTSTGHYHSEQDAISALLAALAHATLAQSAATALGATGLDSRSWTAVAGTKYSSG